MPRYYFHFREGDERTLDDIGLELAGPESAQREAMLGLADHIRDAIPKGTFREVAMEIVDDERNRLFIARLILQVDMVDAGNIY